MNQQIQTEFNQHWQINTLTQISNSKLREAENFFLPVNNLLCSHPVKILDVGCGDGVHWSYLRNLDNQKFHYVGIDISSVALRHLQQQTTEGKGHFIQTDATAISTPDNLYDVVFSFGVVAYTNQPKQCFAEICRVCKPGGWIGLWVYPQQAGLGGVAFKITRQICQRVGSFWTQRIADLIVPFLFFLPTRSKVNLRNSNWNQCREVVLVNIAPKQLDFFERDEIVSWFFEYNIDIEYEDANNPITIWGRKRR